MTWDYEIIHRTRDRVFWPRIIPSDAYSGQRPLTCTFFLDLVGYCGVGKPRRFCFPEGHGSG